MRPQLGAAAAFLRQAAAELRAQATAQTNVSQTPEAVGSALAAAVMRAIRLTGITPFGPDTHLDQFNTLLDQVGDAEKSWINGMDSWMDMFFRMPITGPIGNPIDFPTIKTIASLIGIGTDFVGFTDLSYLRFTGQLPKLGQPLGPFGVDRLLGPNAGKFWARSLPLRGQ